MQRIETTGAPPYNEQPMILAIGKFDGVHIGHQAILDRAKAFLFPGHLLGVMSLWPHPAFVLLGKEAYSRSLTPPLDKAKRLAALGVDVLYDVTFSQEYAKTTAEAFVDEHLTQLNLQRIIVGQDFRFGQGGRADVGSLKRLAQRHGVPVTVVNHVEENGVKVSSSQIRNHIESGRVEAAEALLGRPYSIVGEVVHGDKLARTLGFPTANLKETAGYVLPGSGVYAVSVAVGEASRKNWFGVLNAGFRPTVNGRNFRMEVHLLDFDGDLYGESLEVSFLRRVREERRFDGLDALKQQISADAEAVRRTFGID
jgi:riboflavin kinase / FMN adenylyltransferase